MTFIDDTGPSVMIIKFPVLLASYSCNSYYLNVYLYAEKVLSKYKHYSEVDDISTKFDLFNLTPDPIRAVSLCVYS